MDNNSASLPKLLFDPETLEAYEHRLEALFQSEQAQVELYEYHLLISSWMISFNRQSYTGPFGSEKIDWI